MSLFKNSQLRKSSSCLGFVFWVKVKSRDSLPYTVFDWMWRFTQRTSSFIPIQYKQCKLSSLQPCFLCLFLFSSALHLFFLRLLITSDFCLLLIGDRFSSFFGVWASSCIRWGFTIMLAFLDLANNFYFFFIKSCTKLLQECRSR